MTDQGWRLVMAGPAKRAIQRLPEKVATAVLEFVLGPPRENPVRVGVALRGELTGVLAARVGAYRVLYELDHDARQVLVLDIDHRADIYRPR